MTTICLIAAAYLVGLLSGVVLVALLVAGREADEVMEAREGERDAA